MSQEVKKGSDEKRRESHRKIRNASSNTLKLNDHFTAGPPKVLDYQTKSGGKLEAEAAGGSKRMKTKLHV